GTNLVNDWGDFHRGADGPDRLGPRRAVASGWLSSSDVARGAGIAFGAAALVGVWLIVRGGWPIAAIGIAGLTAAVAYTAGPRAPALPPAGEPVVFLLLR